MTAPFPDMTIRHQRTTLRQIVDAFDLLAVARRRRPNKPGEIAQRHAELCAAIAAARPLIVPPVVHSAEAIPQVVA